MRWQKLLYRGLTGLLTGGILAIVFVGVSVGVIGTWAQFGLDHHVADMLFGAWMVLSIKLVPMISSVVTQLTEWMDPDFKDSHATPIG